MSVRGKIELKLIFGDSVLSYELDNLLFRGGQRDSSETNLKQNGRILSSAIFPTPRGAPLNRGMGQWTSETQCFYRVRPVPWLT